MSDSVLLVYAGTLETRCDGRWTIKVLRNGMLQLDSRDTQLVFKNWDYYKWIKPTGAVV
jgi:hypothetical protein